MRPGTCKNTGSINNFIHKQPIRLDMQFTKAFPVVPQRMVFVDRGQYFFLQQQPDDSFECINVVTALLHFPDVTLELGRINRREHLYAQLVEKIIGILGMVQFLTTINLSHGLLRQGIGDLIIKGQPLFACDPCQNHTTGIRHGKPHGRKDAGGFCLDNRVDSGANIIIGRPGMPPCFSKCSSSEHKTQARTIKYRRRPLRTK